MSQKQPNEFVNYSQEHPLKGVAKMLFSLLLVMLVAFIVLSMFFQWLVPRISFKTEKKWFSKTSMMYQIKKPVEKNDTYYKKLDDLVQAMAVQAGFEKNDIEVYLSCNELNNAFAYPGGKLIFNKGLLETINSENELAMIVGHELGHVVHRDHLKGLGIGLSMGVFAMLIPKDLSAMVTEKMHQWLMLKYNRDQESKADILGLNLLYKHYGHVNGADDFFKKIANEETKVLNRYKKDWFATHPLSNKRLATLNRHIKQQSWPKKSLKPYEKGYWDDLCRSEK